MRKKDLWIIFGAVCAAVVLAMTQLFGGAIPTGAWGLSFQQEGQTPIGPASAAALAEYDAAFVGDTTRPVLYLTFDAGYENGCTEKILDVLKKHEVPAAFFLVGNYIEKNGDLVRRIVEEGQCVGSLEVMGGQNCRGQILAAEAYSYALAGEERPQDFHQAVNITGG